MGHGELYRLRAIALDLPEVKGEDAYRHVAPKTLVAELDGR